MEEMYQKTLRRVRIIKIVTLIFLVLYCCYSLMLLLWGDADSIVDFVWVWLLGYLAFNIVCLILKRGTMKDDPPCPHCEEGLPIIDGLAFCPSCGERVFEDVPQKQNKPVKRILSQKASHRINMITLIILIATMFFGYTTHNFNDHELWSRIAVFILIGGILQFVICSLATRKHCVCPHCFGKLPPQKQEDNHCPHCGEKLE